MRTRTSTVSNLSPRHLRLIDAIAEHGSVHRAARALGVSQPAASMLLRAAEAQLGQPLFVRTRTGALPTPFGAQFLQRLRIAVRELEAIDSAAVAGGRPLLRLGAIPRAMQAILARALTALLAAEPALRLTIEEGSAHQLLEALRGGALDAVIGRSLDGAAGSAAGAAAAGTQALSFERLFDERTVIVEGAHGPRTGRTTLAALAARDWILPPRGSFARDLIDSSFIAAGLQPPLPRVESAIYASSLELAAATRMLTLAPDSALAAMPRTGRVRPVDLRRPLPRSPVYLITRHHSNGLTAIAALRHALLAARRG
jgi:DNA-binding transcriptional LysR family regulator